MSYKFTFRGFQSIRKLVTLVVDGYCVVEGESNLGKSALVRAISAMVSNQAGTDFISGDEGSFEGTIEYKGNSLKWVKERKATYYEINGSKINKPGRGTIPEEVKLFEICPLKTLDKGLHWPQIHFQWEGPFIIGSLTDTVAAELLGASSESAKVSRAIKLVNVDVSRGKTKVSLLEEQNKELLEKVGVMDEMAIVLKLLQENLDQKELEKNKTSEVVRKYQELIYKYRLVWAKWKIVQPATSLSIPRRPDTSEYEKIKGIYEKYIKVSRVVSILESNKRDLPSIPSGRDRVLKMVRLYNEYIKLQKKIGLVSSISRNGERSVPVDYNTTLIHYRALHKLQSDWIRLNRDLDSSQRVLGEVRTRLKDIDGERKQLNYVVGNLERCPLCSSPMKDGRFCHEEE